MRSVIVLILLLCSLAPAARAAEIAIDRQLKPTAVSVAADGTTDIQAGTPAHFRNLPVNWHLLIDRSRFEQLEVIVHHDRGTLVFSRTAGAFGDNWALGNFLSFKIPIAGDEIDRVTLRYSGMDTPGLMRSVRVMSEPAYDRHQARWIALVSAVVGILLCSLSYNAWLSLSHSPAFQRWYVAWATCALVYTLAWTGALAVVFPYLAGPPGVRVSYVLVGAIVTTAGIAFFHLIEPGKLPPRLVRTGIITTWAVLAAAVVAAMDFLVPAAASDLVLNVTFVVATIVVVVSIGLAIRARSRAVWFYLAGWSPALCVFGLRVARNFGLAPKLDAIDMASFFAIGFESVMLSLAIADRYRLAWQAKDRAEAEAAVLLRMATTDALTGLGNRASFDRVVQQGRGRPTALILVDVDGLKAVNDDHGHVAGDKLLRAAAARLREAAGSEAFIARIGGDEFAILLGEDQIGRLSSLKDAMGPVLVDDHLVLSMSMGVAWSKGETDPLQWFDRADRRLYEAKTFRYRKSGDPVGGDAR